MKARDPAGDATRRGLVWKLPKMRRSAASRLRRVAERLEPRRQRQGEQSPAPLVRLGGRWWRLDDIAAPSRSAAR
jgi:hypothetical protein